jgi:hypothetical protein
MKDYKELMELGKEEVERLCEIYDNEVISVSCHKNYQTGDIYYDEPVPEGAIPVHYFSCATHFVLRMPTEFEKLSETQLDQLGSYNNDKYRPSFLAYRD